jgi:hypothetical protein
MTRWRRNPDSLSTARHCEANSSYFASKQKENEPVAPLSFCLNCSLTPMPFPHLPMIAAAFPAVSNPARASMGWTIPTARRPHVCPAFPAVIAVDPDIAAIRGWRTALDDRGRWRDANYNLRIGRRRHKGECKQQCQCSLFHNDSFLIKVLPDLLVRSGALMVSTPCRGNSCASAAERCNDQPVKLDAPPAY